MKKLTYLILTLVSIAFLNAPVQADDTKTITIKKSSENRAKVAPMPNSKDKSTIVPISFASGADWSTVKDSYTVSSSTACGLMCKSETISIAADGTATFHSKKMKKAHKK